MQSKVNEVVKNAKKTKEKNIKKWIDISIEIICTIIIIMPIIFYEKFEEFLDKNIGIFLIIFPGFVILLPFAYRLFQGEWPKSIIGKWYTDGK